jgi:Putative collagen-binding domain of a collagenase
MATYTHDIRKLTLWGNLMAGGAGVEYYFGYQLPENDLVLQDFCSRDKSWDYCRFALAFLSEYRIPLGEMVNANALVGDSKNDNSKYCLAKTDEFYLVYLPSGGTTELDLRDASGDFNIMWFNPRSGGDLVAGEIKLVRGGSSKTLGHPPTDADQDWIIIIRR